MRNAERLLSLGLVLVLLGFAALGYVVVQRSAARRDAEASVAIGSALGATVEPLERNTAAFLGVRLENGGIVVTSLEQGGAAERGGFRPGDVIERVADMPVASIQDLASALDAQLDSGVEMTVNRHGRYVIMHVQRDGRTISTAGVLMRQGAIR